MGDNHKKEATLSDRFNRMFNIETANSNTIPMAERYESVAANQNRLRKLAKEEDNRKKGKPFIPPFLTEDEAQVFSQEYFMESGLVENDKLFNLLSDLKLMQRVVKAPIYSTHNQMTRLPLNENTIKSIFEEWHIPFHEEAAYSLVQKIGATQYQIQDAELRDELKEFLNSLETNVRNKIRKEIKSQGVTYPKIAGELAKDNAEDFRAYVSNLLTLVAENSVLHDGYAVCKSQNHGARDYAAESLTEIVDSFLCAKLEIKPARLKPLFRLMLSNLAIRDKLLCNAERQLVSEIETGDCVAAYYNMNKIFCVHSGNDGALSVSQHKRPGFSVKSLPATHNCQLPAQAENLEALLGAITGNNPELLASLGELFADIADPRRKRNRFTVIHTKHNADALKKLLGEVFFVPKITGTSTFETTSFTEMLTHKGKIRLLDRQIKGERLMFVKDALPTDRRFSECLSLVKGEKLQVESSVLGQQKFYNHIHFVCITENAKAATKFAERCSAKFIDLSTVERKYLGSVHLSDKELQFMRTAFVLRGVQSKQTNAKKSKQRKASIGKTTIRSFAKDCCRFSKKAVCTRGELYEAYCTYYQALHGEPPKESSTVFIKAVREILPRIEYKVKRYGEENATQMCFIGLALKENATINIAPNTNTFHALLTDMGRQAGSLFSNVDILEVRLT